MPRVNRFQITQKFVIAISNGRRFVGLAANAANIKFDIRKRKFLQEFDGHEVTQNLIANSQGKDNLFGFIGFHASDPPIPKLRIFLDQSLQFQNRPRNKRMSKFTVVWSFGFGTPTLEELYSVTPYPNTWKGGSWLRGIENGIPFFESYIYWKAGPNSRSGTGIQAKVAGRSGGPLQKLRSDQYQPRPYMKDLLTKFIQSFK